MVYTKSEKVAPNGALLQHDIQQQCEQNDVSTRPHQHVIESKTKLHVMFMSIPYRGHSNPLVIQAKELLSRGHRVTFVVAEEIRKWNWVIGLESCGAHIFCLGKLMDKVRDIRLDLCQSPDALVGMEVFFDNEYVPVLSAMLEAEVNHLIPWILSGEGCNRPDVLVIDFLTSSAFDMAIKLGINYVVNYSFPFLERLDGSPWYLPYCVSGISLTKMSLRDCLYNSLMPWRIAFKFIPRYLKFKEFRKKIFPMDAYRTNAEYYPNHLVLCNSAIGLEWNRTLPPFVQFVGALLDKEEEKAHHFINQNPTHPEIYSGLEKELVEWLMESKKAGFDVVYVSFGTIVVLTPYQVNEIVQGLNSVSSHVRFLWSLPKEQRGDISFGDRFRMETFVPQRKILSLPIVKVFFSHCGHNSTVESMYFAKPMLCFPFFGDQTDGAVRVCDAGAGLVINHLHFNRSEVKHKMEALLNEEKYLKAANACSACLKLAGGTKRACDLIEDVGWNGGYQYRLCSPSNAPRIFEALYSLIKLVILVVLIKTF